MNKIIGSIGIFFTFLCIVNQIELSKADLSEIKNDRKLDNTLVPRSITIENFERIISEPIHGTFVLFMAPWCGHCKRMVSTWNDLAQTHNSQNKFIIAKVDCTVDAELCSDKDILAYPTLIFYRKNDLEGTRYNEEYDDYESLDVFMFNQIYANTEVNEIKRLIY
jgi:protein disulfide-isomerase-like protein